MERMRRFLEAGVSCFIDLTEPDETPGLRAVAAVETPRGSPRQIPA